MVVEEVRSGGAALRFCLLLVACLGAPFALIGLWSAPPAVNLIWDAANAMGYLALVLIFLLFIYTGRPRAFPPFSGRFFANFHRDIGYLILALTVAHCLLLLIWQPLLLEHLKPTAPVYMLTGLGSALLLVVLVLSSAGWLRRRLWSSHHSFRSLHAWLSISTTGLLLVHVLGSGFYLNTLGKAVVCVVVAVVVLISYLDKRFWHLHHDRGVTRLRDTARYSVLISYGSVVLVLVVSVAMILLRSLAIGDAE